MQDWQFLTSSFVPLRDGAAWQESCRVDEPRIVVCQPRPIGLLFWIGSREVAMQVHDAESLEDVLMRLPIGPSLVKGVTWVSMASGGSIIQGRSMLHNSLGDGDITVAWPSDMWALEDELRQQARDDEEDELLRQVQLPGDTCGVWEQGDEDGTGVCAVWEPGDEDGTGVYLDCLLPVSTVTQPPSPWG